MSFADAVTLILLHEGGYVNDPNDPGGETNFGISKRSYPNEDIKNLTQERAVAIYRRDYWNKIRGDELPAEVAVVVFDAAVNSGVSTTIRWLQQALKVTDDGIIGPQTLRAAKLHKNPVGLAVSFSRRRILFYASLGNFHRYGSSWVQRTLETLVVVVQNSGE